jgi:acyl carrier protein
MNDVYEQLAQIIIRHFGVDPAQIIPAANFRSDMAADSLDLLDLTLSVEDAFGIEINDEAAMKLHTVGDLLAFIKGRPNH